MRTEEFICVGDHVLVKLLGKVEWWLVYSAINGLRAVIGDLSMNGCNNQRNYKIWNDTKGQYRIGRGVVTRRAVRYNEK